MSLKTIELEVDSYVGFGDEGTVEHWAFVGPSDTPIMHTVVKLEAMAQEFIDMHQVDGKIAEYHFREASALCNGLEDAIALIKAAMR